MTQKPDRLDKALQALDEIGVICTDGSSAADIIKYGVAPGSGAKPPTKPA